MSDKQADEVTHEKTSEIQPSTHEEIEATQAKQPIPSRDYYYKKTAKYFDRSLRALVRGLTSKNEMIRVVSAKTIINKVLPDVKAAESTTEAPQRQYNIVMGSGFIPPNAIKEAKEILDN